MYPFRIEEERLYRQYPEKIMRKVEKTAPSADANNKQEYKENSSRNFNSFLEKELSKLNLKC